MRSYMTVKIMELVFSLSGNEKVTLQYKIPEFIEVKLNEDVGKFLHLRQHLQPFTIAEIQQSPLFQFTEP